MSSAEDTPDVSCQVNIRIVKTIQEDLRLYTATVNKEYVTKNHPSEEDLEIKNKLVSLENDIKSELNESPDSTVEDRTNIDSDVDRQFENSTQREVGVHRHVAARDEFYHDKEDMLGVPELPPLSLVESLFQCPVDRYEDLDTTATTHVERARRLENDGDYWMASTDNFFQQRRWEPAPQPTQRWEPARARVRYTEVSNPPTTARPEEDGSTKGTEEEEEEEDKKDVLKRVPSPGCNNMNFWLSSSSTEKEKEINEKKSSAEPLQKVSSSTISVNPESTKLREKETEINYLENSSVTKQVNITPKDGNALTKGKEINQSDTSNLTKQGEVNTDRNQLNNYDNQSPKKKLSQVSPSSYVFDENLSSKDIAGIKKMLIRMAQERQNDDNGSKQEETTNENVDSKLFECQLCQKSFVSKSGLYKHRKNKHKSLDNAHVQCRYCSKVLSNQWNLKRHINEVHGKKDSLEGINGEEEMGSEPSDQESGSASDDESDDSAEGDDKTYKCDHCDQEFTRLSALTQHKRSHKSSNVAFPCRKCDRVFSKLSFLQKHLSNHQAYKHVCDVCGRMFSRKQFLKDHVDRYHAKMSSTSTATTSTTTTSATITPVSTSATTTSATQSSATSTATANEKEFTRTSQSSTLTDDVSTTSTQKYFARRSSLNSLSSSSIDSTTTIGFENDKSKHHKDLDSTNLSKFDFVKESALKPIKTLNKKKETTNSEAKNASNNNEKNTSTLEDDITDTSMNTQSARSSNSLEANGSTLQEDKTEMSNLHLEGATTEKSFTCSLCGKTYPTASELEKHNSKIHAGEKPYQCEICNKRFLRKKMFKIHQRKAGIIKCKECPKTFCRLKMFQRHVEKHKDNNTMRGKVASLLDDYTKKQKETLLIDENKIKENDGSQHSSTPCDDFDPSSSLDRSFELKKKRANYQLDVSTSPKKTYDDEKEDDRKDDDVRNDDEEDNDKGETEKVDDGKDVDLNNDVYGKDVTKKNDINDSKNEVNEKVVSEKNESRYVDSKNNVDKDDVKMKNDGKEVGTEVETEEKEVAKQELSNTNDESIDDLDRHISQLVDEVAQDKIEPPKLQKETRIETQTISENGLLEDIPIKVLTVQIYQCPKCNREYKSLEKLKKHLVEHTSKKPENSAPKSKSEDVELHQCDKCHRAFKTAERLSSHYNNHKNYIHKCEICGKLYPKRALLDNHRKRDHVEKENETAREIDFKLESPVKSNQTANDFPSFDKDGYTSNHGLSTSFEVQSRNLADKYSSTAIESAMIPQTTDYSLSEHTRPSPTQNSVDSSSPFISSTRTTPSPKRQESNHSNESKQLASNQKSRSASTSPKHIRCSWCRTSFRELIELTKHQQNSCVNLQCDMCEKRFCYGFMLRKHKIVKHDMGEWSCRLCNVVFKSQSAFLHHHCRRNSWFDDEKVAKLENNDVERVAILEKNDVEKVATLEKKDVKKVATLEKNDVEKVETLEKNDDEKEATLEKNDDKKEEILEKNDELEEKMAIEGDNPIIEPASVEDSSAHVGLATEITSTVKTCDNEKTDTSPTSSGNVLVPCEKCGKKLKKASMMRHMRIHTGEKPFQCSKCGMGFSRQDHWKRHTSLSGKSQNWTMATAPLQKCDECDRWFCSFFWLQKHMKSHQKKKDKKDDHEQSPKDDAPTPEERPASVTKYSDISDAEEDLPLINKDSINTELNQIDVVLVQGDSNVVSTSLSIEGPAIPLESLDGNIGSWTIADQPFETESYDDKTTVKKDENILEVTGEETKEVVAEEKKVLENTSEIESVAKNEQVVTEYEQDKVIEPETFHNESITKEQNLGESTVGKTDDSQLNSNLDNTNLPNTSEELRPAFTLQKNDSAKDLSNVKEDAENTNTESSVKDRDPPPSSESELDVWNLLDVDGPRNVEGVSKSRRNIQKEALKLILQEKNSRDSFKSTTDGQNPSGDVTPIDGSHEKAVKDSQKRVSTQDSTTPNGSLVEDITSTDGECSTDGEWNGQNLLSLDRNTHLKMVNENVLDPLVDKLLSPKKQKVALSRHKPSKSHETDSKQDSLKDRVKRRDEGKKKSKKKRKRRRSSGMESYLLDDERYGSHEKRYIDYWRRFNEEEKEDPANKHHRREKMEDKCERKRHKSSTDKKSLKEVKKPSKEKKTLAPKVDMEKNIMISSSDDGEVLKRRTDVSWSDFDTTGDEKECFTEEEIQHIEKQVKASKEEYERLRKEKNKENSHHKRKEEKTVKISKETSKKSNLTSNVKSATITKSKVDDSSADDGNLRPISSVVSVVRTMQKEFSCDICMESFYTEQAYRVHHEIHLYNDFMKKNEVKPSRTKSSSSKHHRHHRHRSDKVSAEISELRRQSSKRSGEDPKGSKTKCNAELKKSRSPTNKKRTNSKERKSSNEAITLIDDEETSNVQSCRTVKTLVQLSEEKLNGCDQAKTGKEDTDISVNCPPTPKPLSKTLKEANSARVKSSSVSPINPKPSIVFTFKSKVTEKRDTVQSEDELTSNQPSPGSTRHRKSDIPVFDDNDANKGNGLSDCPSTNKITKHTSNGCRSSQLASDVDNRVLDMEISVDSDEEDFWNYALTADEQEIQSDLDVFLNETTNKMSHSALPSFENFPQTTKKPVKIPNLMEVKVTAPQVGRFANPQVKQKRFVDDDGPVYFKRRFGNKERYRFFHDVSDSDLSNRSCSESEKSMSAATNPSEPRGESAEALNKISAEETNNGITEKTSHKSFENKVENESCTLDAEPPKTITEKTIEGVSSVLSEVGLLNKDTVEKLDAEEILVEVESSKETTCTAPKLKDKNETNEEPGTCNMETTCHEINGKNEGMSDKNLVNASESTEGQIDDVGSICDSSDEKQNQKEMEETEESPVCKEIEEIQIKDDNREEIAMIDKNVPTEDQGKNRTLVEKQLSQKESFKSTSKDEKYNDSLNTTDEVVRDNPCKSTSEESKSRSSNSLSVSSKKIIGEKTEIKTEHTNPLTKGPTLDLEWSIQLTSTNGVIKPQLEPKLTLKLDPPTPSTSIVRENTPEKNQPTAHEIAVQKSSPLKSSLKLELPSNYDSQIQTKPTNIIEDAKKQVFESEDTDKNGQETHREDRQETPSIKQTPPAPSITEDSIAPELIEITHSNDEDDTSDQSNISASLDSSLLFEPISPCSDLGIDESIDDDPLPSSSQNRMLDSISIVDVVLPYHPEVDLSSETDDLERFCEKKRLLESPTSYSLPKLLDPLSAETLYLEDDEEGLPITMDRYYDFEYKIPSSNPETPLVGHKGFLESLGALPCTTRVVPFGNHIIEGHEKPTQESTFSDPSAKREIKFQSEMETSPDIIGNITIEKLKNIIDLVSKNSLKDASLDKNSKENPSVEDKNDKTVPVVVQAPRPTEKAEKKPIDPIADTRIMSQKEAIDNPCIDSTSKDMSTNVKLKHALVATGDAKSDSKSKTKSEPAPPIKVNNSTKVKSSLNSQPLQFEPISDDEESDDAKSEASLKALSKKKVKRVIKEKTISQKITSAVLDNIIPNQIQDKIEKIPLKKKVKRKTVGKSSNEEESGSINVVNKKVSTEVQPKKMEALVVKRMSSQEILELKKTKVTCSEEENEKTKEANSAKLIKKVKNKNPDLKQKKKVVNLKGGKVGLYVPPAIPVFPKPEIENIKKKRKSVDELQVEKSAKKKCKTNNNQKLMNIVSNGEEKLKQNITQKRKGIEDDKLKKFKIPKKSAAVKAQINNEIEVISNSDSDLKKKEDQLQKNPCTATQNGVITLVESAGVQNNCKKPINQESSFVCKKCNARFGDEEAYSHHRITHNVNTSVAEFSRKMGRHLKCPFCTRLFKKDVHVKNHVKLFHRDLQLDDLTELNECDKISEETIENDFVDTYREICVRELYRRRHYHTENLLRELCSSTSIMPPNCFSLEVTECDRKFIQLYVENASDSPEINPKRYLSLRVSIAYELFDKLDVKKKKSNLPAKSYTCDMCAQKLRFDFHSYVDHVVRKHLVISPFNCSACGLTCLTSTALHAHQESRNCGRMKLSDVTKRSLSFTRSRRMGNDICVSNKGRIDVPSNLSSRSSRTILVQNEYPTASIKAQYPCWNPSVSSNTHIYDPRYSTLTNNNPSLPAENENSTEMELNKEKASCSAILNSGIQETYKLKPCTVAPKNGSNRDEISHFIDDKTVTKSVVHNEQKLVKEKPENLISTNTLDPNDSSSHRSKGGATFDNSESPNKLDVANLSSCPGKEEQLAEISIVPTDPRLRKKKESLLPAPTSVNNEIPNELHSSNKNLCPNKGKTFLEVGIVPTDPRLRQLESILPLSCEICGEKNKNNAEFRDHTISHLVDEALDHYYVSYGYPFKCQLCQQMFKDCSLLKNHLKLVHKSTSNSIQETELEEYEVILTTREKCIRELFRRYYAHHCNVKPENVNEVETKSGKFPSQNADDKIAEKLRKYPSIFVNNFFYGHLDYTGWTLDSVTLHYCPHCDFMANGFINYIDHVITHLVHTRFACFTCARCFQSSADLGDHMKRDHPKKRCVDNGHLIDYRIEKTKNLCVDNGQLKNNQVENGFGNGMIGNATVRSVNFENHQELGGVQTCVQTKAKKGYRNSDKLLRCLICGKKFKEHYEWEKHSKNNHQGMTPERRERARRITLEQDKKRAVKNYISAIRHSADQSANQVGIVEVLQHQVGVESSSLKNIANTNAQTRCFRCKVCGMKFKDVKECEEHETSGHKRLLKKKKKREEAIRMQQSLHLQPSCIRLFDPC